MTKVKIVLVWMVLAFVARTASAQTLNFVDQVVPADQFDKSLLHDHPTQTFQAGAGIWAVIGLVDAKTTFGSYFQTTLRVSVSLSQRNGSDFDLIYTKDYPIHEKNVNLSSTLLPILPDKPDPTFPGYDLLMRKLSEPRKNPKMVVKVRIEGDDSNRFTQNGFFYDATAGLGRYAEWMKGAKAVAANEQLVYEREHIGARTTAVHGYRAVSNAKVEADAKKWWHAHNAGLPLDGAKVCSDLIIVQDQLGFPSEKQYCVLYTYKGNHKCWAQMRRLTHRRVGRDTYENDFVDSTYDNMSIPMGEEKFWGGHEYEVSCK